jgi:hypothetical protein
VIGWDELVAQRPYHGYRAMLIRLDALLDAVREFLFDSWLLAAPKRFAAQFQPE